MEMHTLVLASCVLVISWAAAAAILLVEKKSGGARGMGERPSLVPVRRDSKP